MTKPNEQHQFDLIYMPHNLFEGNTYRYILTSIDVTSRYKVARTFRTKKSNEVAFVLEAIYKNGGVCKYRKSFQCDNGSEFENEATKLLENTTLRFEEQQQNSWKNCCLNQWMLNSFKTIKSVNDLGQKFE